MVIIAVTLHLRSNLSLAMPRHIALHRAGGYLAASFALPSRSGWCSWLLLHLRQSSLPIAFEFVMNLVGFLAGTSCDLCSPPGLEAKHALIGLYQHDSGAHS